MKIPEHYNNDNGSLYKIAEQRGWNAYQFDIIKRIDRATKKGEFIEDLEKTKTVIDLWISESVETAIKDRMKDNAKRGAKSAFDLSPKNVLSQIESRLNTAINPIKDELKVGDVLIPKVTFIRNNFDFNQCSEYIVTSISDDKRFCYVENSLYVGASFTKEDINKYFTIKHG